MVIGAAKSGTNSLHRYLDLHPQVFMIPGKENSYFAKQKFYGQTYARTESEYLKLYAAAPHDAVILGESSVVYSSVPLVSKVPQRIHAFNPAMKFVYLMREPIDRIISHYLMLVRHRLERRTLIEAATSSAHLLQVSHYAMQLQHFFDFFPRDQFFITTTETLRADRQNVVNQLFAWMNLEPLPADDILAMPEFYSAATEYGETWYSKALKQKHLMRGIKAIIPQKTLKQMQATLLPAAPTKHDCNPSELVKVRSQLQPITDVYVQNLSELLGRDFPEWRVHGT